MLEKLLLCFFLTSVTSAIFIREKCGPYTPEDASHLPLSQTQLDEGHVTVTSRAYTIMLELDELIPKLVSDITDKDWQDINAGLVKFMDDGLSLYKDMLYGTIDAYQRMLEGDYNFTIQRRCRGLRSGINNEDGFGQDESYEKFATALRKDLPCFSNHLSEIYGLKLNGGAWACLRDEGDAIRFLTELLRILFRLRNDGDRFFHHVAQATALYSTELHAHFIYAFNGTDGDSARSAIHNFDEA